MGRIPLQLETSGFWIKRNISSKDNRRPLHRIYKETLLLALVMGRHEINENESKFIGKNIDLDKIVITIQREGLQFQRKNSVKDNENLCDEQTARKKIKVNKHVPFICLNMTTQRNLTTPL